jgi:hypothetical protein
LQNTLVTIAFGSRLWGLRIAGPAAARAILSATAASDIFTQDLEDFASSSEESEQGQSKDTSGHQEEGSAPPAREIITGIVSEANSNEYKGRVYYFAKMGDENLMTAETNTGQALLEAAGQEIEAVCIARSNKGPHHYKLISFTYLEPESVSVPQELSKAGTVEGSNPF